MTSKKILTKYPSNPFRYGKPVPPSCFIGRSRELNTIFGRLLNNDSTAVIGAPHIGKSSFLRYIRDEEVRSDWLGEVEPYAFIDIDCHLLPGSYQPSDFWKEVLDRIEEAFPESTVLKQLEVVRQNDYSAFVLKRFFEMLTRRNLRVVLLIDEFDVLLYHRNFNTAEFFGVLRSISTLTDSLLLVVASRMSIAEMNRRSQEINPVGSPFFNNLTEVRLQPLRPAEVDELIDQTLEGTGVTFSQDDRTYIMQMTGRHPFLVQVAAAALFTICTQGECGEDQRIEVNSTLQRWAAAHYEDTWRHLNENAQRVMHVLALADLHQPDVKMSNPMRLEHYNTELQWLAEGGLIEVSDVPYTLSWNGEHWRINGEAFAHWIVNNYKVDNFIEERSDNQGIAAIHMQIREHERRLHNLQITQAQLGIHTDSAIIVEIEDIEHKIAELKERIQKLSQQVA